MSELPTTAHVDCALEGSVNRNEAASEDPEGGVQGSVQRRPPVTSCRERHNVVRASVGGMQSACAKCNTPTIIIIIC